jgi:hypothetical protein
VGIPAWVWFVVAVVAGIAGAALLLRDRARLTSRNRERRRWAALRGWQFADTDHVLPTQWSAGAIAFHGGGVAKDSVAKSIVAKDVVAGSTFTADGRRRVYVFDLETGGRVSTVIAAVQCRRTHPAIVELWLSSAPIQRDSMLELLGPVGDRYAFVSDLAAARGVVTPDLTDAIDEIGADIPVTWVEGGWVLAGAGAHASPSRLERLLRGIGEIADVIDPFDAEIDPVGDHEEPTGRHGERRDPPKND